MPRMPILLPKFFIIIICARLSVTSAQGATSPVNITLGASTGKTANTTSLVLVPPQTTIAGTDTVVFQAPNAIASNWSILGTEPGTTTLAAANSSRVQQQLQQQQPAGAVPAAPTAAPNEANQTEFQSSVPIESASIPNDPITIEEALLMHAQLQDLLLSEGGTYTAAGSDLGTYQGLFDAHNQFKTRHQGSLYSWSSTLASSAAGYASRCIFAHDPYRNAGENIYATTSKDVTYALSQASSSWYDEVSAYDFNTGAVRYGLPGNTMIGHFTQMVWLGSSVMGCAAALCNFGITNFQPGTIIVCRYAPAGNVVGQYVQNVRPATSSSTGSSSPAYTPAPAVSSSNPSPNLATVVAAPGQDLNGPGCRSSPDQRYWLCVWDTGEAIFYQGQTPRWRTNTSGRGRPFRLVVWSDGNMYLNNAYFQFVWQSATARGTPPHRLLLQNDGQLVLYDANNNAVWSVS